MGYFSRRRFGKLLFDYFDRIYCINLDSRPDRWMYAKQHFKQFGLSKKVHRFSGIDLRSRPDLKNYEKLQSQNFSLLGNCGCTLSHRKIIEAAKAQEFESILVFEDDVKFLAKNIFGLGRSLAELKQLNWSVFYLGATYVKPIRCISQNLIQVQSGANATHAIAYHRSVFDKILDLIPDDPLALVKSDVHGVNAVDIWLNSNTINHDRFYGTNPIMAVQGLQNSDIAREQQDGIEQIQIELFYKNLTSESVLEKSN